jgi:hypothetical protein
MGGDYFTIYDFQGALDGSAAAPSADWSLSVANTTRLEGGRFNPTDDPTMPDYTWTYNGTEALDEGTIGSFSLVTPYEQSFTADYTFVATGRRDDNGRPFQSITSVAVPLREDEEPPPGSGEPPPGEDPPPESPEPATFVMFGLGLPALGLLRLRRKAS